MFPGRLKASRSLVHTVALGLAAALLTAGPASAQRDGVSGGSPVFVHPKAATDPSANTSQTEIHVTSNLVTTPVLVMDRGGNFVYDLQESDFKVYDNGVPQKIVRFESELTPLAVVILVQISDKVGPLLKDIKPVAPIFSSLMLGAKGSAAVLCFDSTIRQVQDFSSDGAQLEKTFRSLAPAGPGSHLNDALMQAIDLLEQRPRPDRRIVVAFSEGFDSGSETSRAEILRRATANEVEIYGLGLSATKALLVRKPQEPEEGPAPGVNPAGPTPPGMPNTPELSRRTYEQPVPGGDILGATDQLLTSRLLRRNPLAYYARFTGGFFYSQWSPKVLQNHLDRVASEISSQYEIAYVPDDLRQAGFHRITIRVNRPGVSVRARAGYFYTPKQK